MSYQCQECKKYTLDMDEPPCGEGCQKFLPRQVITIHHTTMEENKRLLTCTGNPPESRVRLTSTPFATTCPLCLEKIQADADNKVEVKKEVPTPEPVQVEEPKEEVVEEENDSLNEDTLQSLGFTDNDIDDIKAHAEEYNLPNLDTPTGLRAWLDEGNDITEINGIGPKSKERLLPLLNKVN